MNTTPQPHSKFTLWNVLHKNRIDPPTGPDQVALSFGEQNLAYAELEERANRIASALEGEGFVHGDRLAVVMFNRPEWFDLYFALAKLGGVIVPVNYYLKPAEIRDIMCDAGAKWVVCEDELWEIAEKVRPDLDDETEFISVGKTRDGALSYEKLLKDGSAEGVPVRADLHDLFLLQYTSGTTGLPKGVMHTQETVLWNILTQIADFQFSRNDVFLCLPALCWSAGFNNGSLTTLWVGGNVVLHPSGGFDPDRFCELIAEHGVTRTLLVPVVLRAVLDSGAFERHDTSSLRTIYCGAEPVPVELIERTRELLPECTVVQGYGLSEFPAVACALEEQDAVAKVGSIGRAVLTAEVRILDGEGNDCPPGESGEIVTRSPTTMLGYYNKPEETAAALRDGWLHTGDLGFVDDDGFVYVSGRKKDMIISGGLNVYPAEVERVLEKHPGVAETAVIGVPDDQYGEVGMAVVVTTEGSDLTESQLLPLLREELASFKVPKTFTFRQEPLPRTTSGKVQKHIVREQQGVGA